MLSSPCRFREPAAALCSASWAQALRAARAAASICSSTSCRTASTYRPGRQRPTVATTPIADPQPCRPSKIGCSCCHGLSNRQPGPMEPAAITRAAPAPLTCTKANEATAIFGSASRSISWPPRGWPRAHAFRRCSSALKAAAAVASATRGYSCAYTNISWAGPAHAAAQAVGSAHRL